MKKDEGLLAAVIDAPDDDAPRMIYADWFDEHDEPDRAEFIRVQVALSNPKLAKSKLVNRKVWCDCEACQLLTRERELIITDRHAIEWRGNLVEMMPEGRSEFHRGFIHRITCNWVECLDHMDAVLAEHPVVEVELTSIPMISDGTSEQFTWEEFVHGDGIVLRNKRWPRIKRWVLPPPRFDVMGIPLPIIHSNFEFSARDIARSRRESRPMEFDPRLFTPYRGDR